MTPTKQLLLITASLQKINLQFGLELASEPSTAGENWRLCQ